MAAKFQEVTTPTGTAIWPRLNQPDTKFDKNGVYSMRLRLEGEPAAHLSKLIDVAFEKLYREECAKRGRKALKKAALPYKPAVDKEKDGTETPVAGAIDFNMKRKASGERRDGSRWEATVALFDAANPPKPTNVEVWGGSKVRACFALVPWFTDSLGFGVRLELRAVQVVELVQGGQRQAEGYGFSSEEGGFSAPAPTPAAEEEASGEGDIDQF